MFNYLSDSVCFFRHFIYLYTQKVTTMSAKTNQTHPYIQLLDRIAQRGVIVIDNIPAPPLLGEAYIANDLLIIVCHSGAILNDEVPEYQLRTHDVSVLMPEQIMLPMAVTKDLRCTNIAVSRAFYEQLIQRYPYTQKAAVFRRRPPCLLTEEQFTRVLDAVNLIRTISLSDSTHRLEQLGQLLNILLCMLYGYHIDNYPDEAAGSESLFNRFYDYLIEHHRENRDVAFYARKCCLSPKHFSAVIRQETGSTPMEWVTMYVIIQAKSMLKGRKELTIQQIAHQLGFSEQASFTRYFKNATGMTPTEYRGCSCDL